MKKLIVLLALLLPLLSQAQDPAEELQGTWTFHPCFELSKATNLIDTEHYVYALTNGALVRWDKANQQITTLSSTNGLNDFNIKNIYYNYAKHYLLVTYTNSNIDLLYEDGQVANVNALADAVLHESRAINDVTFAEDAAILATDFGLVVLDDSSLQVREFRYYGKALTSAAMVGDYMIVSYGGNLYSTNARREVLADFYAIGVSQANARIYPVNDSTFFLLGTGALKRCDMDPGGRCDIVPVFAATPDNVQQTVGGWLANFRASSCYYTIANNEAFTATKVSGNNSSLFSCSPYGGGTTWQIDANGIHVKGSTDYHKPDGIYLYRAGAPVMIYSYYNPVNGKFYVTTHDQRYVYEGNKQTNNYVFMLTYDGSQWTDTTPTALRNKTTPGPLAFVPGHDNALFFTIRSGNNMFRVVNGEVDLTFVPNVNNPYTGKLNSPRLAFDSEGNLWMCSTRTSTTPKDIACMLPHDKVMNANITKDDWIVVSVPGLSDGTFQNQIFCIGKDDVKVTHGGNQNSMTFTLWRGTPDSDNPNVESVRVSGPIDQNGKAIEFLNNYIYTMSVDSTGLIWVGGTVSPVFYFDPSEVMEGGFRVTRPQVTEGDESPYEAYIAHIATDHLNRKWLATTEQGIYVMSPDGSRMLKHFDVDNSGLPSSRVYSISTSPTRAIALTENGIVEFNMSDIPEAIDYTAVTAAPTFVEPGYTGFVTIGQVDVGACVRITDRDGNVVREFTATGSQVAWDACDDNGERLPTGVYSVYAGLTADQLPATPQVRVRIIK